MNKIIIVSLIAGIFCYSCRQGVISPEKQIAQELLARVDSFKLGMQHLENRVNKGAGEKDIQQSFLQLRSAYKNMEWGVEYFVPATSRFVNGPPVEEIEPYSHQVFEAEGLQVMEAFIFPKYDPSQKKELIRQLNLLQTRANQYKVYFKNIDILQGQVFDAAKLEIYRVITLGIAGFDDPLSKESMKESANALSAVQKLLDYYLKENETSQKDRLFNSAQRYLEENNDFNSFNRAIFITKYANPITTAITDWESELGIHVIKYNRLLNQNARTLFDTDAINPDAYAPNPESFATPNKIALGRALFSDPILSGNNTRSCQTCHEPSKGFTDGLVKNTVLNDHILLARNTPTLINAALQPSQFYDLRVNTLEDQSNSVVQNELEMHGSMKLSVKRLWHDKNYKQLFSTAFPKPERSGIDTLEVMNALACYIRSLSLLNSRFDEYMRGNSHSLNTKEINGFNLFMGKAKCGTCHYLPLFNGTFPPRFIKIESEVIGVPTSKTNREIDPDLGRYSIIPVESLKHSFKIPTVRNASATAPYMHNGVFKTLDELLEFYNNGGSNGLGQEIKNQTLSSEKLELTKDETDDIIAFIRSLDSK